MRRLDRTELLRRNEIAAHGLRKFMSLDKQGNARHNEADLLPETEHRFK